MTTPQAPDLVRTMLHQPTASGGRRGFHKTVRAIDDRHENAQAFLGDFLRSGRETDLPRNTIIVRKTPHGSARNEEILWSWARTPSDGISWEWSQPVNGRQFLSFRDQVRRALQETRRLNNGDEAAETWLLRPGETVTNPRAAPPKESAIQTAYEFFAALAHAGNRVDFDPAKSRFTPANDQAHPIARDANRFLDAVEARCPAALAGQLGWSTQRITLRASRDAIFQSLHGLDEKLIIQSLQTQPPAGRPARPQARTALQQLLREADAEVENYRQETWQTVARNLQELGLKLYPHPAPDTKPLFT